MLEMPDACPTSSGETDDVDADDAGPFASPSPTAAAASGATNAAYVQEASTNASAPSATAASANPSATARRAPTFTASGVISGVTAIIAAAAGSVASPASSALRPKPAGS